MKTPLTRTPISVLTLEDTGQSFSASPIRSYISSSAAGAACAPDALICSRIAAARSRAARPRYNNVSTGTMIIGPIDDCVASGLAVRFSRASMLAPSKSLFAVADAGTPPLTTCGPSAKNRSEIGTTLNAGAAAAGAAPAGGVVGEVEAGAIAGETIAAGSGDDGATVAGAGSGVSTGAA